MALKDWKKIGKNKWKKKGVPYYYLKINPPKGFGDVYEITVYTFGGSRGKAIKFSRTKQQALRYAKSYMRKK